jgi:hypothetical protein
VHLIRLATPWGRQLISLEGADGDWERVQIPDVVTKLTNESTLRDESVSPGGSVIYRRTFNRPTNLENQTPVWLVIESLLGRIVGIEFNGHSIEISDSFPVRISIAQRLQLHNDLRIELAPREGQIGLSGPVRLEIED